MGRLSAHLYIPSYIPLLTVNFAQDNQNVSRKLLRGYVSKIWKSMKFFHAIIAIYADLHFSSFRQGKPFDQLDYESRLDYLSYEDSPSSEDDN